MSLATAVVLVATQHDAVAVVANMSQGAQRPSDDWWELPNGYPGLLCFCAFDVADNLLSDRLDLLLSHC